MSHIGSEYDDCYKEPEFSLCYKCLRDRVLDEIILERKRIAKILRERAHLLWQPSSAIGELEAMADDLDPIVVPEEPKEGESK